MKLLFDQNISYRIIKNLKSTIPECSHVKLEKLQNAGDLEIWEYAKKHNFTIVSFDADFYDLATLKGAPPKVIWLRTGNTSTSTLEEIINSHLETILEFLTSDLYQDINCLEIDQHKA